MSSPLLRLVVLYGGVSAEHDVSRVTAAHVLAAADRGRYTLVPVGIAKDGTWHRNDFAAAALAAGDDIGNSLDIEGPVVDPVEVITGASDVTTIVFPLLHGPHGEDGTVQGMLELLKVPYVGCGVLSSSLCMDKGMAKEVAARAGIPQCRWVTLRHGVDDPRAGAARAIDELGLPVFVKPANMGSSVGVSRAGTADELDRAITEALRYDDVVVIEEAVTAREIEVGVLGNGVPETTLPGEIRPGSDFYDYTDKYVTGAAQLMIPADLPDAAIAQARELAGQVFVALRCAGMARVDFFYEEDGRGWLLNEVNTIPGFTPASMYPKMWEATGLAYPDLIDRLVALALDVYRRRSSFSIEHA
ncbi:D-alanine--D-alanine ligase [Gordonia sp. PP30]|uniref:D-alanine--D-alanine ligase family protein n=1 Tax=unclassified Gordonia (in: high G+C Gram-positive bacteria) TaxID=2657482 RepID=UPI001FFF8CFD|nr:MULTISPECIES: D-alanine--D-alanine ligase family protein [unclassified Gordonia (in: high G+C Gram-positive bacteria)]UQE75304.1 D-alanine--D-alanine ligase [Gordonia sp. PP30]